MLPPNNCSIVELAKQESISDATLYNWRQQARDLGKLMPDSANTPEGWQSRDKFAAVLETASMSEAEVAEYCRQRGRYPEQLSQWDSRIIRKALQGFIRCLSCIFLLYISVYLRG